MADFFDNASDTEALHREMTIAEIRNRKSNKFTGHCLSCNEPVKYGRFCCSECHEDWELAEKMNKLAGNR